MDWLSNSWVVEVGAGIISGLVVSIIVSKLGRRWAQHKDEQEYFRQVHLANKEVLLTLRQLVTESTLPTYSIIESLVSATARRYGVWAEDLNTVEEFVDDLVKEVLDTNFIPNEQKLKYCTELQQIKETNESRTLRELSLEHERLLWGSESSFYRSLIGPLSLLVGILTGFSVPIVSFKLGNASFIITFFETTAAIGLIMLGLYFFLRSRYASQEISKNDRKR